MLDTSIPRLFAGGLLAVAVAVALAGCSESKGHKVTGKVTFKGQPVAGGKIYFTPEGGKDGGGLPGYATIKDGAYDTSAKGSQGVSGGKMVVKIEGLDASGKLIFVHMTSAELPAESTTKDFDVPESAANNVPKDTGPQP